MGARTRFQTWRSRLSRSFPPNLARLMLLVCAALWGGSYTMAKIAMVTVPPSWLMFFRMFGACLLMLLLFRRTIVRRMNRAIVIPSLVIGGTYYAGMLVQSIGLRSIDPGRSAFLTAGYSVLIPFVGWAVTRHRPELLNMVAAFICMAGVGFIALKPNTSTLALSEGDWLTLLSAMLFAVNLVFLGVYTKQFHPLALTFTEFAVAGVLFLISAVLTEPFPQASWLSSDVIYSYLYLLVGATTLGQILQNIGLAHVPASSAAIIMCTESVFSVVFSALFWGEHIGWTLMVGFALIFAAIVLSVMRIPSRFEGLLQKPDPYHAGL